MTTTECDAQINERLAAGAGGARRQAEAVGDGFELAFEVSFWGASVPANRARSWQSVRMGGQVEALTTLMRTSDEPSWRSLRRLLRASSIDCDRAYLAESVEQADDSEFAVVVDDGGRVVMFGWQPSTSGILDWEWISDTWQSSPYREVVAEALDLQATT